MRRRDLSERISKAISGSGEAHMPAARIHGHTSWRACFLHYENDDGDVERLVVLLRRFGKTL